MMSERFASWLVGGMALTTVLLFIFFSTRSESWEEANRQEIVALCEEVEYAIALGTPQDAQEAHDKFTSFVGERDISDPRLEERFSAIHDAYAKRLPEVEEFERKVETERAKQAAARAARQRQENRKADRDAQIERYMQSRWRYYEARDGGHFPSSHDPLVLQDAARRFGISQSEALAAFRRAPDSFYGN